MSQRQHGCDGRSILSSQPDLNFVAHTFNQVSEPCPWLRRYLVTLPGHHQDVVELLDHLLRAPCLVSKPLPLCAADPALDGIPMQTPEDLFQRRGQIENMQEVCLISREEARFFTAKHWP